jgi:hypothetical protein
MWRMARLTHGEIGRRVGPIRGKSLATRLRPIVAFADDPENVALFDDGELFAIDLDLTARPFVTGILFQIHSGWT